MATMADVARLAGVSTATVSHVLNGTRPVSVPTVEAVRDAMRRTGYTPNSVARSLARASSHTIGVAVSAITNHYFSDVVSAIEAACSARNFMMFLSDTHDDPEHQLRVVQELHQRRVDGVVLATASDSGSEVLNYLRGKRVATVLIDRLVSGDFDQVGVENVDATADLVRHLASHGHKRIGFVYGKEGLATSAERLEGYHRGLASAGLTKNPELLACGESVIEGGRQALRRLMRQANPPTALVTGNNLMTIGALLGAREMNIRIPEDLSLVGFDNFDWAEFASPSLTVMAQPAVELGKMAVDLLMRRLEDPSAPKRMIRLAPKLIIRASCGCTKAQASGNPRG